MAILRNSLDISLRTVLLSGLLFIVSNTGVLAHTDVTVEQARDLIDYTSDLIVVDVREESEYCDARGHIPGALNYPWNSGVLGARYEELPIDSPIMVVCRSGGRSNMAANFLDSKGFSTVYDIMGGMNAWIGDTSACKYAGGSGTSKDPYQIATVDDLLLLGDSPEDYDKQFILVADIDMESSQRRQKVFDRAVIAPDINDIEPGFQGTPFTGVFDGGDHVISYLTISGESYLGLFGQLGSEAKVINLGLEAVDVYGTSDSVGGLVGFNYGSITATYSSGSVSGNSFVGGLVGTNDLGAVTDCYSSGSVSGNSFVGGLVGYNMFSDVTNCYSSCSIQGRGQIIGGLVGDNNHGRVLNSYSSGSVSGNSFVGGLVGIDIQMEFPLPSGSLWRRPPSIANCYSTGRVSGDSQVGGLVGQSDQSDNSAGIITSCFWDVETSGQTTSDGGTGLTTQEMQDIQTYRDAGWDFVGDMEDGLHDFWQMSEEGGYPVLAIPHRLQGQGTPDDPYLISDTIDLGAIVHYSTRAHYQLVASIDLSGISWVRPVIPSFEGTFNGNGHIISHLMIEGENYLGLFGQLKRGAELKDLGVVDVNVTGSVQCVGGLVGFNEGEVVNCYSTGLLRGNRDVGGLVGHNESGSGTVTQCYSTGTVIGSDGIGGLVGQNDRGTITQCYSTGTVNGETKVGGLVGETNRGNITSSFWDMESSNQAWSDGGGGLTTTEMQTANTFLEAGWDFVGETENGTEDIWWIDEGQDYPRLFWELTEDNQ